MPGCTRLSRFFLIYGSLSAFLSVAFGAFGAHALKATLSEYSLSVFQTANQYHMFHSLALIALSILSVNEHKRYLKICGGAFLAGIILFSGSLYALAISGLSALGVITPIGGLVFLLGWAVLFVYALKASSPSR